MTDEDMFETMDRILGDIPNDLVSGFWGVADKYPGMKIYLSADQLELWEGESE